MKKSETCVAQDAKSLEAPIQLTPAQLEIVAAGFARQISLVKGTVGGTILTGAISPKVLTKTFQF